MVCTRQPQVWEDPTVLCLVAAVYCYVFQRYVSPKISPTTYLDLLIIRYITYIALYFGSFRHGLFLDHSTLTSTPSSRSVLDALKHSFSLCYVFRPTRKDYHRHEKYLIHRMQKGIKWYKRPLQTVSLFGICWALCVFYWRFLNPRTDVHRRYESKNDFMSFCREDFSMSQGLILVLMAVSALVNINFARIYGRQMGNDSLVRLVRESLKEAKKQYGFQGEELWLQWWIDEVSKESERLQDELERRKFEKAGTLTDTAWEESQLPLKTMRNN